VARCRFFMNLYRYIGNWHHLNTLPIYNETVQISADMTESTTAVALVMFNKHNQLTSILKKLTK